MLGRRGATFHVTISACLWLCGVGKKSIAIRRPLGPLAGNRGNTRLNGLRRGFLLVARKSGTDTCSARASVWEQNSSCYRRCISSGGVHLDLCRNRRESELCAPANRVLGVAVCIHCVRRWPYCRSKLYYAEARNGHSGACRRSLTYVKSAASAEKRVRTQNAALSHVDPTGLRAVMRLYWFACGLGVTVSARQPGDPHDSVARIRFGFAVRIHRRLG